MYEIYTAQSSLLLLPFTNFSFFHYTSKKNMMRVASSLQFFAVHLDVKKIIKTECLRNIYTDALRFSFNKNKRLEYFVVCRN